MQICLQVIFISIDHTYFWAKVIEQRFIKKRTFLKTKKVKKNYFQNYVTCLFRSRVLSRVALKSFFGTCVFWNNCLKVFCCLTRFLQLGKNANWNRNSICYFTSYCFTAAHNYKAKIRAYSIQLKKLMNRWSDN